MTGSPASHLYSQLPALTSGYSANSFLALMLPDPRDTATARDTLNHA
jgi:hypothetical protein